MSDQTGNLAAADTAETDVATREEFRVTYEGNEITDWFDTEDEALDWAARWKSATIDRRTVEEVTKRSRWTRVAQPGKP